jgi:cobalt-zinc-cadmium resistance protein CzcA
VTAGAFTARGMGADFVPRLEEGDLVIQLTRPPSVSVAESEAGTTTVERVLGRFPEVQRVVSRTGSPDVATDIMGLEQSDIFVLLTPRSEWQTAVDREGLISHFDEALTRELPGTVFSYTQPIEMRIQELLGGVKSDVGIKVFGDDVRVLQRIAMDVARITSQTPGAEDVRVEPSEGLPLLSVRPNMDFAARVGVSGEVLRDTVELLREGREVGLYASGDRRFPIQMRYDSAPRADVDALERWPLSLGDQRRVTLGDVATLSLDDVPAMLSREQGRRRLTIEANVRGRDLGTFVQELQSRFASLDLPEGYYFELSGQYENLVQATERLLLVVPSTLLVILFLLYFTFGAFKPALLILLNVPLATTGGVFALALRGLPFSVSAAVGFIALFGVATMNGVVLLSAIREHEKHGNSPMDAAIRGATERLRPVVTTAVVASLGFLPMALATGTGAEVQRPLATVVIGGLMTATFLTLFVLPTLSARSRKRTATATD